MSVNNYHELSMKTIENYMTNDFQIYQFQNISLQVIYCDMLESSKSKITSRFRFIALTIGP